MEKARARIAIAPKDELPYLLKLVDDPSPTVRDRVAQRLRTMEPGVMARVCALPTPLTTSQQLALEAALGMADEKLLLRVWRRLQQEPGEEVYLESAYLLLMEWQSGPRTPIRYRDTMDRWAAEFLGAEAVPSALSLAAFLFKVKGLSGAPNETYYDPLNSNLAHCLENGYGLPITLSSIFILMGSRVGVRLAGCNFPGHFLARDMETGTIFDPYNARVVPNAEVSSLRKAAPRALDTPASSREIIGRVLRNLCLAYHQNGENEKTAFLLSLTREMKEA